MNYLSCFKQYLKRFIPPIMVWIYYSVKYKINVFNVFMLNFEDFLMAKQLDVIIRPNTTDKDVLYQVLYEFNNIFTGIHNVNTIIDVGANCGISTVWFAKKYPAANIIALEPEINNFNILQRNISKYHNIVALQCALLNHDGRINLYDTLTGEWGYSVTSSNGKLIDTVQCYSMITLMNLYKIDFIDILKIDIEGSEFMLFDDTAIQWVSKVRMITVEIHDHININCSRRVLNILNWCPYFSCSTWGELLIFKNINLL